MEMHKHVTVMITIDNLNKSICDEKCTYFDKFFERCKLFNINLAESEDEDKYSRCEFCLRSEVN